MKSQDEVLSSYLAIKGGLSETTYRAFSDWDLSASDKDNFQRLKDTNSVGASSAGWLKQFIQVLKRRYDLSGPDRSLIELVQQGWHIDDWRPIQLWHMSRSDELLRIFLTEWLFDLNEQGIVVITSETVIDHLKTLVRRRLETTHAWKDNTYQRVASGLLKTAAEFQLMRGRVHREFAAYRLPEKSFMYLLYALMEREQNTRKMIEATDWRLFLMKPQEVEEELLRLHQYGKLHFERAGSLQELTLPCNDPGAFARSAAT